MVKITIKQETQRLYTCIQKGFNEKLCEAELQCSVDLPVLQSCRYHFPVKLLEKGVGLYLLVHQLAMTQRTLYHIFKKIFKV